MNIVFMGTPEFSVPSLRALINNYNVKAVFTQPDRPKGRGKKLAISPVKQVALENNISVFQPIRMKNNLEIINELKNISPDFIIVLAFGQILPQEVLDIPKYGCICLHASLLPKYRGAAPLNWCIINGEKESGNTTMLMDVGIDTGDILLKSKFIITDNMNKGDLHDLLKEDGSMLLVKTIDGIVAKEVTPIRQNNEDSSYASMLDKELAKIDWSRDALKINNLIRGLYPSPAAYTTYKNSTMKIFKAIILEEISSLTPGTIIEVSKLGIKVSTGSSLLLVENIQFPNGKPLKVEEYIKGNVIEIGTVLV